MGNLALLTACLLLGIGLRASGRLPESAHTTLNALIVQVALPALVLLHLHDINLTPDIARGVAMAWVMFGMAVVFFVAAGRVLGLSRATVGGLILTAGLANTSFVGVPMIEAYFGRHNVGLGLMIDQLGTYLILATLGVYIAARFSGEHFTPRAIVKKICTFPPLLAVVVALLLRDMPYPEWLSSLLARLGDLVAPLALLSVGYQLRLAAFAGNKRNLGLGLVFKLVLAPAVLTILFVNAVDMEAEPMRIALFEAAMPPMIGGAIIAAEHKLNPPLLALMVGVGIPVSFLTLAVWREILVFV
jgi:malate permease and related proteins